MKTYYFDSFLLCLERTWCDDNFLGGVGYALGKDKSINNLTICLDGNELIVDKFIHRNDFVFPKDYFPHNNCGFVFQISRQSKDIPVFIAQIESQKYTESILIESEKNKVSTRPEFGHLFSNFQNICNQEQLSVLEIGSRIISPGSVSKRNLFSNASSYTGFDFYPDENTDVTGDAHKLSTYFPNKKFKAIFSISVFEHLAMPWLAALEINKLLEIGGLTFHSTHFAWPLHDEPWDFWRFTDNGLRALFSSPIGFEVIDAGFFTPVTMHLEKLHPGQEKFPLAVNYGGVCVIAKKIADFDPSKFTWDTEVSKVLAEGSLYPINN